MAAESVYSARSQWPRPLVAVSGVIGWDLWIWDMTPELRSTAWGKSDLSMTGDLSLMPSFSRAREQASTEGRGGIFRHLEGPWMEWLGWAQVCVQVDIMGASERPLKF